MFLHEIYKHGNPDHVAFCGKANATYGELERFVDLYRNELYSLGVREGNKVGLYCGNCAEFVYAYMAVVSLGAIIVPINNSLIGREVDYILDDSEAIFVISDKNLDIKNKLVDIHVLDSDARSEKSPKAPDFPSDLTEDDVCTFVYTSGTTGAPKGAMLSHKNLIRNAQQTNMVVTHYPNDNTLCVLPMFHCYGWTLSVINPLLQGCTITVLNTKNPAEILRSIEKYKVTTAFMVPPIYNLMARKSNPEPVKTVRLFVSGGACLPQPVAQAFFEAYGHPVIEGYGLTEASPVCSVLPPDQPKYLTCGKAIPGVEAKIHTDDDTKPYKPGVVGELWIRGDNVMKGYWKREKETKETITKDGWLRTGDIAYMDKEGYIYIVDRIKDMIIVNGENVYPREVEERIYELKDVGECAVVGHPDAKRGETIWAYIVMKEGETFDEDKIRGYLLKNLAPFKVPHRFIPLDELPKNPTGKILKRVLRDRDNDI